MTEIEYSDQAVDQLGALERHIAERIVEKIEAATEWTDHRLRSLTGSSYYTVRIGDYRAIIDWNRDADVLFVIAVGHRKNIYDRYL